MTRGAMTKPAESAASDSTTVASESATDSLYRQVFRISPSPVILLDVEGRIHDWNAVCERLSGFTVDEVRGKLIWEVLLPPDKRPQRSDAHRELMQLRAPRERLGGWYTKSGRFLRVLWNDLVIQNNGRTWIIQTGVDRSETLRANSREREIFDQLRALICVRDKKGRFVVVNRRFRTLYQLGGLVVEGLCPEDLMPPEQVERIRRLDQLAVQTHRPQSCALKVASGGDEFELATTVFPLLSEDGTVDGLCMIAFDVTEEHRIELALAERTRDVLDLSTKLITAREDERRILARDLHDGLNQDLAALSVELGMLAQMLPEGRSETCAQIQSLAGRCVKIADEVRRLSHELHPASLEIFGLRDALSSFALETARVRGHRIVFSAPEALPPLPPLTATCLYRIAQEAVANAIKHSGAKEIHLKISLNVDRIRLIVEDEGSGFDVAAVATRGLGMISMQERARLLKGELTVQSRVGGGTRIQVEVPAGEKSV